MPAIITDQFRILNAETFVGSFSGAGTTSYYYSFLGHPNPTNTAIEYGQTDWQTNPPDPKDSFEQESSYHNSMLFMKRITSDDVRMIIPRFNWQSGSIYDRYRHNIDNTNPSTSLDAKTLYESKYIVVNSEYKVYLCINNGEDPENKNGQKSTAEPNFATITPQKATTNATDGYIWKYLFTISPADVIKFATEKYIPLPKDWGTGSNLDVFNSAVDGKLEKNAITIKNRGSQYKFSSGTQVTLPIYGDGVGGKVSISINSDAQVESAEIVDGGVGYTKAFVIFQGVGETGIGEAYSTALNYVDPNDTSTSRVTIDGGSGAEFEIACPPKGGHGFNINRECGAHRVMVYSKYDSDPDYVTGNNFSRIGIVKNPTVYNSSVELLKITNATSTFAMKLQEPAAGEQELNYPINSRITQVVGYDAVSMGSSIAVGYVASFDQSTHILKYYQPVGLSTLNSSGYKILPFNVNTSDADVTANITCNGTAAVSGSLDANFGSAADGFPDGRNAITLSSGKYVQLGQTFTKGIAPPEVERYSGDIIYIDNRQSITRSPAQKEELKIVVEF